MQKRCGNNGLKKGTYKFAQSSGIDYLNVDMVMEVPKDNADKVKLKYEGETINGTVKDGKMIFLMVMIRKVYIIKLKKMVKLLN